MIHRGNAAAVSLSKSFLARKLFSARREIVLVFRKQTKNWIQINTYQKSTVQFYSLTGISECNGFTMDV